MTYYINLEIDKAVATINLDKQPLNVLSLADIERIIEIFNFIKLEKSIKIIVFKSCLENFSAGMDIGQHSLTELPILLDTLNDLLETMLNCPYPIISLIQGKCMGGGLEIALYTDIILATKEALLGQPEIKLAHMAPFAITILPLMTGYAQAAEMILTGKMLTGIEAKQINLVNQVYEADQFNEACEKYIQQFLNMSQVALKTNIQAFRLHKIEHFKKYQSSINAIYLDELSQHNDATEGIQAFKEKRPPQWEV
jgi:cyclohexa-1,5-dienecarbonyl-CoA hydratase